MPKKSIGLKSEKKLCTQCSTFFCTFLCHCFAVRLQRTLNFLVARFMEEKSYTGKYVPTFHFFFFSLPLILTLLAANICHFLIAALNFSCFVFRNELRLLSFCFFFVVVVFSFALALSLLSASVQCYKGGTAERTIT